MQRLESKDVQSRKYFMIEYPFKIVDQQIVRKEFSRYHHGARAASKNKPLIILEVPHLSHENILYSIEMQII